MLKNKKALLLLVLYLLVSTAIYLLQPQEAKGDSLRFFFQDPNIADRIRDESVYDRGDSPLVVTRVYHNKVGEAAQVFIVGIYRAVDLPFLFSLTSMSTMYDDHGKIHMMFPIELPLFFIACWYLIRHWDSYKKEYGFLIPLFLASLFITGLFYPPQNTFKLLPLVLTIRLIIFIGIYEWLTHTKWAKKYSL